MPNNLLSYDQGTDRVYKHSGISSTILDSFSTVFDTSYDDVRAITWDGANLIGADYTDDKIYKHNGFSSAITDCFSSPSDWPYGLAWDGQDLLSGDFGSSIIYKHSGFSSTIKDTCSGVGVSDLTDLAWDGANVLHTGWSSDKVFKHDGFSSTILDSFALPGTLPLGITWDGDNLISTDQGTGQIYKHSGFSSTITDSFSSPSNEPSSLDWEFAANQAPTAPTSLEVDEKSDPTGANCISDLTPGFTAIYNDPDAGDQANAINIQVGTASGLSDMWDSGWIADSTVESNRCTAKTYDGAALSVGTSYWWRCRFRDDDNAEGAWSEWQQFDICAAPALNLVQMALI